MTNASSSDPVFASTWRVKPLVFSHIVALLFFLSLWHPTGMAFWRSLDTPVYFFLNETLAEGGRWARAMAWANSRREDLVAGSIMLCFFLFPGIGFRRPQLQQALIGFLALMIFLLPFRLLVYEIAKVTDTTGPSPTRQFDNAHLVTEMFPDIPTKDGEGRSFPGDHATVMVVWAGYLLANDRRFRVWPPVLLVTFLATAPRVIVGSHWLSDVILGGLVISLPILAWARFSPLPLRLTQKLERIFLPLFAWAGRTLPIVNKLPFFHP